MANAALKATLVDYTVDGKEYQGYLVQNEKITEPRPAVVVFPEWWGINEYVKRRARELADLGYVAFVADMYGQGMTTTNAEEANKLASAFYQDFAKFETMTNAAYEQMLMQAHVDTARTAAIGFCFGGTAALELARSGAPLKGCVSFHGGLAAPNPERARSIKGRVLVLHGDADPFVPNEQVTQFDQAMTEAGVNYKVIHYAGAKHAFTNPNADKTGLDGVAYDAEAEKASMTEMRVMLSELFAKPAAVEDKKE
ncbi:MAG: dienelactone hydrolase family protein [bacterium]|nr:dienelactone hydrolase family protein [bacterium]